MVRGKSLTDKEYFKIEIDSSSSLKDFADDRKKYYNKYILKNYSSNEDEDESKAIKIGNLVDCLLLNEEEFDLKFYRSSCPTAPTGKMMNFVQALLKYTFLSTDDSGKVTKDFATLAQDAYNDSKFERSLAVVLNSFKGTPESYYNEMRESRGRTLITESDYSSANKVVNELKSNDNTYNLFRKGDDKLTQLIIDDFNINGLPLKSKLDLIKFNHSEREIEIYDLKVTWSVENFKRDYYLKRRAYIQAAVYYTAVENFIRNTEYSGYKVLPPKFIVSDSIAYYQPLIYEMSDKSLENAMLGFVENGYYYEGVRQIVDNLKWAKDNNIWSISQHNFKNKGIIVL